MHTTTLLPIDRVLDRLRYEGSRDKTSYKCHCPAHTDNKESLSVSVTRDGKVLLKCHAGCKVEEVLAAMGLTMKDLFPLPSNKKREMHRHATKKEVAVYPYRAENGEELYQVVRYDPKGFSQRRLGQNGEWIWDLKDTPRVLYRLPELIVADPEQWVFIVEGEKDTDNLREFGQTATTCAQGAGKWLPHFNESLRDRRVCILPDNDEPGRKHAHRVAKQLVSIAECVRVLELPDLPLKGDVSDWLKAGGNAEKLLGLVEQTPDYTASDGADDTDASDGGDNSKTGDRKNQADVLYDLALTNADIFADQDGKACGFVDVDGHRECYQLDSRDFHGWLTTLHREHTGKMPTNSSRQEAIAALAYAARNKRRDVFVRVGGHGGKVYIDLGTEEWDALEIDEDGWRVIPKPPVAFRRSASLKPLPLPQSGARLSLLKKYLNIEPEHWPLVAAWLVGALNAAGPYPILVLAGEQGTAKSTTIKVLKELIDPSAAGLRGEPGDTRDLMVGAHNSWLLAFDNVSQLKSEVADALCRVATGGGYAKRANYRDAEEVVFDFQRPVAINGIGDIITRPDLMDRSIMLCPPVISEDRRRSEKEFWQEFNQDRPLLLGALLDALSIGLRNYHTTTLVESPRMADFTRLAVAAESAFDSELSFLEAYQINREEANATVVETSTLGELLRDLVLVNGHWEGTMAELLEELRKRVSGSAIHELPRAANKLRGALQRISPSLRHIGVEWKDLPRNDKGGSRRIRIERLNV